MALNSIASGARLSTLSGLSGVLGEEEEQRIEPVQPVEPSDPDSLYERGMSRLAGGVFDGASSDFRIAAEGGHILAAIRYAELLSQGKGIGLNKAEAAKFLRMAADQGDVDAQYSYALAVRNGEGVVPDFSEALRYLRRAAEQGHRDSLFEVGIALESSDFEESFRFLQRAASLGHPQAQFKCGLIENQGELKKRNVRKASAYFKEAADQGVTGAEDAYLECLREIQQFRIAYRAVATKPRLPKPKNK
jgi:TPR repeat protein